MKRAVSVSELYATKFNLLDFTGDWLDTIGTPELFGSWIIYGNSGEGKTRASLKLAKYLTRFGRVAYNSLEEGVSFSMQEAFKDESMHEAKGKIDLISEPLDVLIKRLKKQKSPKIVFFDSLQYTGLNYRQYLEFQAMFPKKLFIWISHAEGKMPAGRVAKSVLYDCFVKMRVEGFKLFPKSRYGGKEPFVIWKEGADKYWGELS